MPREVKNNSSTNGVYFHFEKNENNDQVRLSIILHIVFKKYKKEYFGFFLKKIIINLLKIF